MTSYNNKKLVCLLCTNHNNEDEFKMKQHSYKRLFSEFKNILEFRPISVIPTNLSDNTIEDINLETITPNEFKSTLLNTESIEFIINNYKNIILEQFNNNDNSNSIYLTEIQLFLIQKNSKWYYFYNNNNDSQILTKQSQLSITTTILISLNSNNNFNIFINYQIGTIVQNNNKNYSLNDLFSPKELRNTFNQLPNYYYIINSSLYKSCLEMIETTIRNKYLYEGTFEIHVSVEQPTTTSSSPTETLINKFKEFCKERKLKPILIELSVGKFANQMMTSSHHSGNLYTIQLKAYEIALELLSEGYNVSRLKIEILSSCKGVPITDLHHKQLSPSNYFEFHIKLILPTCANNNSNNDLTLLKELMVNHKGHLSKNSFKINTEENYQERFITLRMYGIGRENALSRFESCKNDLLLNNFNVASSHREYSIYDSNIGLDAGWID